MRDDFIDDPDSIAITENYPVRLTLVESVPVENLPIPSNDIAILNQSYYLLLFFHLSVKKEINNEDESNNIEKKLNDVKVCYTNFYKY